MILFGLLFGLLLILVGVLTWVSVFYFDPESRESTGGWNFCTCYFLVLLRLAIGWHFLVEGMDKVKSESWSGETYLRESQGPLAPMFRSLAGDRLIDKLTAESNGSISLEMEVDFTAYRDAVVAFYNLDDKQTKRVDGALDQVRKSTWLTSRLKKVEVPSPVPPAVFISLPMPARLKQYQKYHEEVEKAEKDLEQEKPNALENFKTAKATLQKWRADLKRDAARLDKEMKRAIRTVLAEFVLADLPTESKKAYEAARKKIVEAALQDEAKKIKIPDDEWELGEAQLDKNDALTLQVIRPEVQKQRDKKASLKPLTEKIAEQVLIPVKGKFTFDLVPEPVSRPMSSWQMLDWSDNIVKWGTVAVGICLLLGLFTRTACVVGAGFLLLFFLAMPPLAGWPENPKSEGHYLYINKNIIEMLALLALSTTRSGRWIGLDGLLQFVNPRSWRAGPPAPRETEPLPIFPGVGKSVPRPGPVEDVSVVGKTATDGLAQDSPITKETTHGS